MTKFLFRNRKLSFILWDVIEGEDDEDSLEERIFIRDIENATYGHYKEEIE